MIYYAQLVLICTLGVISISGPPNYAYRNLGLTLHVYIDCGVAVANISHLYQMMTRSRSMTTPTTSPTRTRDHSLVEANAELCGKLLLAEEEIEDLKKRLKIQTASIKTLQKDALKQRETKDKSVNVDLTAFGRDIATQCAPVTNVATDATDAGGAWSDIARVERVARAARRHTDGTGQATYRQQRHANQHDQQHHANQHDQQRHANQLDQQRHTIAADCVVIGSSLTRGLSTELNKNGVDSIGFVYPGCTIPRLKRQINQIGLSKTEQVVVLCGGNDLDTMSPATVVKNYDAMIHDLKRHAPSATIHVINIPPRGENPDILTSIDKVNTYLRNRGNKGDNVIYHGVCPIKYSCYKADNVHFNQGGTSAVAKGIAHAINFHRRQSRPGII